MNSEALLAFLVPESQRWIKAERDRHYATARPISAGERSGLRSTFSPSTLDRVRVKRVPEIGNPDFYAQLGTMPLDFRQMAGITYDDTILISDAKVAVTMPSGLLFHELVHVVQYVALGIDEFARRYVEGWARNGFDYFKIPLEVQAYELQAQFERGDLDETLVEPLVTARLGS